LKKIAAMAESPLSDRKSSEKLKIILNNLNRPDAGQLNEEQVLANLEFGPSENEIETEAAAKKFQ
jgi:hypothetical protein